MNLSHHPTQTNTKEGPFEVLAGENLTGKEGRVVKLTHDTGVPEVILPNDVADEADYLLLEGGADGTFVIVVAIDRQHNVRIVLDGTCNPGDKLTLAAIDGTKDGAVRTVSEVCQLRIKDVDLDRLTVTIYEGKGDKDRKVRLPEVLVPALQRQIARAKAFAAIDIDARQPVQLPGRLAIKYPAWQFQDRWHFVFPSPNPCTHPRTKQLVRWCIGPEIIQRAVKAAAQLGGVEGKVTPHCLRHAFCQHLLDIGTNINRVAEAMGHTDIRTTAGYGRKDCLDLKSPLDRLVPLTRSLP